MKTLSYAVVQQNGVSGRGDDLAVLVERYVQIAQIFAERVRLHDGNLASRRLLDHGRIRALRLFYRRLIACWCHFETSPIE